MRRANETLLGIALAVVFADGVGAQQSTVAKPQAQRTQPLVLTETIPLEGIKGRFDHFGFGGGQGQTGKGFDRFYLAVPARCNEPGIYAGQD